MRPECLAATGQE